MHSYEVEIKSLLGEKHVADAFRKRLLELPNTTLSEKSSQLNHYFIDGSLEALCQQLQGVLTEKDTLALKHIAEHAQKASVRTRQLNEAVILVIKASVDDTTSENGIARVEREIVFPQKTLAELDAIVRSAGYEYQAKWSRDREEYKTEDAITVTIDRNAGYGYVAEFEKVVDAAEKVSEAQKDIRALMEKIGVEELSQDRLERMFAYYNEHWEEYYGTDKTFVVT
jgi:adenylate cyclase class IV